MIVDYRDNWFPTYQYQTIYLHSHDLNFLKDSPHPNLFVHVARHQLYLSLTNEHHLIDHFRVNHFSHLLAFT